jgi:hypothetical protein
MKQKEIAEILKVALLDVNAILQEKAPKKTMTARRIINQIILEAENATR